MVKSATPRLWVKDLYDALDIVRGIALYLPYVVLVAVSVAVGVLLVGGR